MHKLFFFLGVIAMVGCGDVVLRPDDDGNSTGAGSGGGPGCAPGEQITCQCPSGVVGTQICAQDGSGFGLCNGCFTGNGPTTSSGEVPCTPDPDEDHDGDGFTLQEGDCNDCDPNMNPGRMEVGASPGQPDVDDDCDGSLDALAKPCDDNLALDDTAPLSAAKAIELCRTTTVDAKSWGLVSAQYVRADSTPTTPGAQVGLQPTFGPELHVQKGARLLALSTGRARTPGQPDACLGTSCTTNQTAKAPVGFPIVPAGCPEGPSTIADDVALDVVLRTPTNAVAYSFNSLYLSFDWTSSACTTVVDHFVALVTSPKAPFGNVLFDDQKIPPSPNFGIKQICKGCQQGTVDLPGTGFAEWGDGEGSGWMRTLAPVIGGDLITLRFTIWDGGDGSGDATALVDNFQWLAEGAPLSPVTTVVPIPK